MKSATQSIATVRPLAVPAGYARRHTDILEGPTTGHQPRVWGYLFELAIHHPFPLTPQHVLPREAAAALADMMVLRVETVQQALQWLLRNDLLVAHPDLQSVAMADVRALRRMLHQQQQLERAGAGLAQIAGNRRVKHIWKRPVRSASCRHATTQGDGRAAGAA